MEQLMLPMLTVYSGPRLVSAEVLAGVLTYREAVRSCWQLRTRRQLTQRALAEEAGLYASHLSDYMAPEGDGRRELPARHIAAFEVACGNRLVTQWLTARAGLTVLEQFIPAARRVA